ncbi:MAG TPA: DUF2304 domain-containing protein [Vicinamibacterales bacterium]|jgi:hypothetical protein|nr:DUF2304 domain-containing protein [Vicinamibacterales bacterium]
MTDAVQVIAISISAALLLLVLELVRRRKLTEEHSFIWIIGSIALLCLSIRRDILHATARTLGVHYPPAVLILALGFLVFVVSLYFSVVLSQQRKLIERLVEDLALLESDLRELRRSVRTVAPADVVPGTADHRRQAGDQRRVS